MTVDIKEEFEDPTGSFALYDTYDPTQAAQLAKQQHVDIRRLRLATAAVSRYVFDLDTSSMAVLDALQMSGVEASTYTDGINENWTGTFSLTTTGVNWPTLRIATVNGTVTASSVTSTPVDISGMSAVSVALPNFPLATVTTAASFIDISTDPSGGFAGPQTVSVAFSASTVALNPGNSELRFLTSALNSLDLTKIYGIRFRIQATGVANVDIVAIRALAANWEVAPMDYDTLNDRFYRPPTLDGNPAGTVSFPGSWPILLRSTNPPGTADPRPIDFAASLVFNTGSRAVTGTNGVALYFREAGLDENQQLDLDTTFTQDDLNNFGTRLITNSGTSVWTQSTLPGKSVQPDFGRALFDTRPQSALDILSQSGLDSATQFSLERVQDTVSRSYYEVKLTWTQTGSPTLTLENQGGTGQTLSGVPTLTASTSYALYGQIRDNTARIALFALDTRGLITSKVFDQTIFDDSLIHRYKGRIGWYASLLDGNAYVAAIRPHGANFGEYLSVPLYSDTPTSGAQITAHFSPNLELIVSAGTSSWGGLVTADDTISKSGYALKVAYDHTHNLQGVQSNLMYLDNLKETDITFDLYVPNTQENFIVFLYSKSGSYVQLAAQPVLFNTWQSITITLGLLDGITLPGWYRLVLLTPAGDPWYIDNLSCKTRVVSWEGRGRQQDAWGLNASDWLSFKEALNSPTSGMVFTKTGRSMQVRARALRQTASISDIAVQPKYATLGNFLWSSQRTVGVGALPTPVIGTSHVGRAYTYSSSGTTAGSEKVIAYIWSFGDGSTDMGPSAAHTYINAGTYTVSLTVVTFSGRTAQTTTSVVVS